MRFHAQLVSSPFRFPSASAQGRQLSLRSVSKELAARGFLNELGKPYAAKSVASMLA
jgi:hypothetical protein